MSFGIYLIFNKYTRLGISTKMTKKDPFLVQTIPILIRYILLILDIDQYYINIQYV